jgi:transcriptional regulator with XRE-family HTH domain
MAPDELRRVRERLGWTQADLADALGVHRVTVAKWEAGDRSIPEPVARLAARILKEERQKKKR